MTEKQRTQWAHLKELHPTALLMSREGDFYALYGTDAETADPVLPISAHTGGDGLTWELRFPHHRLDMYLPKLVRAGHRIAIFDFIQ